MRKPLALCGALALVATGSGCVSLADYNDLKARYSALAEQKQRVTEDLARDNARLNLEKEKHEAQIGMKDAQLDAKDKELEAAKGIRDQIMEKFGNLKAPDGSSQVTAGDIETGENWIRFSGEVLFDAGHSDMKPQGKAIMAEVAKELKAKGYFLQVDGHTDTDPIKRTLGKFPSGSNFELGAERALAVLLFLEKEGGIEAAKMHLSSWGEYQPAESGNKRKNRRVEIRFTETDPYRTAEERK